MHNIFNKIKFNNFSIYRYGHIFYGLSILLISAVMIFSFNSKFFNSVINQKNIAKKFKVTEDALVEFEVSNFKDTNELEIKTGKYNLSTNDLKRIFEKHSYSMNIIRERKQVPDITINKFPDDFSQINSTKLKKSLFIKALLPLIIKENNKIQNDRNKIATINSGKFKYINRSEAMWLKNQFIRYRVSSHNTDDLLLKVDEIPVSIALAQAAIESGWGTSRFVNEGNALFGQWSWNKGSGIVPTDRNLEETYEIKSFDNLSDSVESYMKNLNTNVNYKDFRRSRNEFKQNKSDIDSISLLKFLSKYAQNENYPKILEEIIVKNNFKDFDNITIYIAPYEVVNLITIQ